VRQQQWSIASFQRRFTSNDAAKTEAEKAAAEAPVEDGLTPAQQDAQAEPTNAADTIGADGLEQLTKAANGNNSRRRANDNPPNKTLYIGNLYYEVTTEQLQRVFTRFGEVESVKIVYDNRGLSRG
jgi:nucleolin